MTVGRVAAQGTGIPVASVAAGFPAGQTPMEQRLQEIEYAVQQGATGTGLCPGSPLPSKPRMHLDTASRCCPCAPAARLCPGRD